MGVYKLSKAANNDIAGIYEFGIENFGIIQAKEYLIGMHNLFQTIADSPNIGRDASEFALSLQRFAYKSHIIFYLTSTSGIFVVRALHQSMDYQRYL